MSPRFTGSLEGERGFSALRSARDDLDQDVVEIKIMIKIMILIVYLTR